MLSADRRNVVPHEGQRGAGVDQALRAEIGRHTRYSADNQTAMRKFRNRLTSDALWCDVVAVDVATETWRWTAKLTDQNN